MENINAIWSGSVKSTTSVMLRYFLKFYLKVNSLNSSQVSVNFN